MPLLATPAARNGWRLGPSDEAELRNVGCAPRTTYRDYKGVQTVTPPFPLCLHNLRVSASPRQFSFVENWT